MHTQAPLIRVGLAGFGMSGRLFHAPFLAADPRFALRRVYERTTERAREEYPEVEIVHSFAALLTEDIDLVVITTPNPLHVPMAQAAIQAGKHVVVEKPVAAASAEAEALRRLAEERGVVLTVYQNRRLDGDFLTVKRLIREGLLGEVVDYESHFDRFVTAPSSKAWKRQGGEGVDVLYDLGVHLIDQAYALFGMPEAVCADLRHLRPETSGTDRFTVALHYPALRAVLSASEIAARPGPRFIVHGRKGSFLKLGMDPQEAALLAGRRPLNDPDWGLEPPESHGTFYPGGGDPETIPTERGRYGSFYDDLYRALTTGAPPMVTPEQAADVLRIIEAARKSDREGCRVTPV